MPLPNRNVDGGYRYNYQGQELDRETGKVAFEARLYDSRINRWLTIDPAHEFHSPYLAMGNNWVSVIDPDGRCTTCPDNAKVG
ncbi:MAG: RHS repeat-associated core domain-containing protein, partial [Jhaorihella sp.]